MNPAEGYAKYAEAILIPDREAFSTVDGPRGPMPFSQRVEQSSSLDCTANTAQREIVQNAIWEPSFHKVPALSQLVLQRR